jgi:hypothetical protein
VQSPLSRLSDARGGGISELSHADLLEVDEDFPSRPLVLTTTSRMYERAADAAEESPTSADSI